MQFKPSEPRIPTESSTEKRVLARRRYYKSASISLDGKSQVFDCIIRDASVRGARLKVSSQLGIANAFRFMAPDLGLNCNAKIVWRDGNEMGVRFSHI